MQSTTEGRTAYSAAIWLRAKSRSGKLKRPSYWTAAMVRLSCWNCFSLLAIDGSEKKKRKKEKKKNSSLLALKIESSLLVIDGFEKWIFPVGNRWLWKINLTALPCRGGGRVAPEGNCWPIELKGLLVLAELAQDLLGTAEEMTPEVQDIFKRLSKIYSDLTAMRLRGSHVTKEIKPLQVLTWLQNYLAPFPACGWPTLFRFFVFVFVFLF
jgi:hypothetical protein